MAYCSFIVVPWLILYPYHMNIANKVHVHACIHVPHQTDAVLHVQVVMISYTRGVDPVNGTNSMKLMVILTLYRPNAPYGA